MFETDDILSKTIEKGKEKMNGKTMSINREEILALTRRMTVKRTSMTRIAGCYADAEGFIDGTFNVNFLKLSPAEREKNLELAKTVPFAQTNQNLKRYVFPESEQGGMRQLLMGIRDCGLKNDALLDVFYEKVTEVYQTEQEYAVYLFHDRYDIPAKAKDKERLGESEQMFEYLICVISPVTGDYEPGKPECGFLFPAFLMGSGIELCGCVSGRFRTSASGITADIIFRKILKKRSF